MLLLVLAVLAVVVVTRAAPTPSPGGSSRGGLSPGVVQRVNEWRGIVTDQIGTRYGVTVALVLGLIARESGGKADVTGGSGERGLCQVNLDAYTDYERATGDPYAATFDDVWIPEINVRVASWYLAEKIIDMGSVRDGLRAYNRGTAGASRDKTAGADYANWILQVGEPAFRSPA